ncbi:MAG: site-specific DNA-methyltransferase [Patescibacteria group bacterium]|nr:site-specific DNA-methyltransferase [Patescibacteria group bacterium]
MNGLPAATDVLSDTGPRCWTVEACDCRDGLRRLPDNSVNCVVTSPPYWGLRWYSGVEPTVWRGDREHRHTFTPVEIGRRAGTNGNGITHSNGHSEAKKAASIASAGQSCECGAWRGQLGMEPMPQAYIAHLVEVFEEVRRVLCKDGTCWIVIGDCYANDGKYGGETRGKQSYLDDASRQRNGREKRRTGLKTKDRVMIPARVALALQDAGWWLRDEIVWHKRNPLPTSVGDRTCPAHEMIYMLTKSAKYHYDRDAIATPITSASQKQRTINEQCGGDKQDAYEAGYTGQRIRSRRPNEIIQELAANRVEKAAKRSVWTCSSQPFSGGHFATFPEEIPATCILAGCPEGGVVCDPFSGSGTTGVVARKLGRRFIGFEASAEYAEMSIARIRNRGENGSGVKPLAGQTELF